MAFGKSIPIGAARLIVNGKTLREKHFRTYPQSKRIVVEFVRDSRKIIENPNNIIYIEVTRY